MPASSCDEPLVLDGDGKWTGAPSLASLDPSAKREGLVSSLYRSCSQVKIWEWPMKLLGAYVMPYVMRTRNVIQSWLQ